MGDYTSLPKPPSQLLSSSPSSLLPPPPPSPPPHRSTMPILYYGLVVVATAAIILAIYNLIVVRWCASQYRANQLSGHRRTNTIVSQAPSARIGSTSSFRYMKKGSEEECSVCLSVFEDGEEVRKLPRCNHSFHASCIDMWLYSHLDCPLCRAPVADSALSLEHSRDGLLDRAS